MPPARSPDPVALLRSIAARPVGGEQRYVPVR
jgi:hypothetical protein